MFFGIPLVCSLSTMQCAPDKPKFLRPKAPPVKEYKIPYHPGASCYIKGEFYESCPGEAKDLI